MSGITIKEYGLRYVFECLQIYWGESLFLLIFIAGIIWSVWKKRKHESMVFVSYALFLGLTVYNPVVVKYVIPAIGFEVEYYRFFWLLPVIPGTAYYTVCFVFSMKQKYKKVLAAVITAVLLMAAGEPLSGVVTNYIKADNIYKIPDDLRAVCDVIHEDCDTEMPRVVFQQRLNTVARQYDASLRLVLHRNYVLYRSGVKSVSVNTETKSYQRQKLIMDAVYYNEAVDHEELKKAFQKTKTQYIVVELDSGCHELLRSIGTETVAQTAEHVIYRYPLDKNK